MWFGKNKNDYKNGHMLVITYPTTIIAVWYARPCGGRIIHHPSLERTNISRCLRDLLTRPGIQSGTLGIAFSVM